MSTAIAIPSTAVTSTIEFNYDQLSLLDQEWLREKESKIQQHGRNIIKSAIEIGIELIDAEQKFIDKPDVFWTWTYSLGYSEGQVKQFIKISGKFLKCFAGDRAEISQIESAALNRFHMGALSKLAGDKIPHQALEEAIQQAESGKTITRDVAELIIEEHSDRTEQSHIPGMPKKRKSPQKKKFIPKYELNSMVWLAVAPHTMFSVLENDECRNSQPYYALVRIDDAKIEHHFESALVNEDPTQQVVTEQPTEQKIKPIAQDATDNEIATLQGRIRYLESEVANREFVIDGMDESLNEILIALREIKKQPQTNAIDALISKVEKLLYSE